MYPQGMMPGTMSSTATIDRPVRRRGGILRRLFLVLILLLAILAGAWFFGVRPYLHAMAQSQLTQALNGAESQMLIFQLALPSGSQVIHVDESSINNYLSAHNGGQLQNLHATILPDDLKLDFSAYGFNCTILLLPVARNGELQVTNVHVQGVLWLVMSDDELTSTLNSNFADFSREMHRTLQAITLHEHEMDVQIA
jgi:type II secretory pathway pseudopilin PulG